MRIFHAMQALMMLQRHITHCTQCPRLVEYRTRVARECLAKMMEEWGELLIEPPIPTNVALAEAARDGRLLYEADPESAGAAAYYRAAAEIVARWRASRGSREEVEKGSEGRSVKSTAGARA